MRVGIVVFPGSNCDRDMHRALSLHGHEPVYCWHADPMPRLDAAVLPGGFSYGDRLRAGAIAASSPAVPAVRRMAERGKPVLGVCNGFQILAEAGLLPGALLPNDPPGFECSWVGLDVENASTPFTRGMPAKTRMPVACGEGRYHADEQTVEDLERAGRIVFRYSGSVNGSAAGIAGVCSEGGNVLGMMPHPERACEPQTDPLGEGPSSAMFESLKGGGA